MAEQLRSLARELVLQGLYAAEIGDIPAEEILATIIVDEKLKKSDIEFAHHLFALVMDNRAWADQQVDQLAHNWELGRIATIDLIILRMAMTELKEMVDVPVKVVLNEAIELAKRFSSAEASKFVNGILDSFVKNPPKHSEV